MFRLGVGFAYIMNKVNEYVNIDEFEVGHSSLL